MWLNRDTHHVWLPRKGHLNILPEGGTSSAACRRVSQLKVCQLFSWGLQVIYLVGLNGHDIPLITSLSKSLANGTNLPGGKPIYIKVDIPQFIVEGPEWKVSPPGNCPSILMVSPIKATPPKAKREVSMAMEVRELLFPAGWDMSGHVSENLTPKRLNPVVILTPLPYKLGDPFGPVEHHLRWVPQMMLRWWKPPWRNPCFPLSHSQDTRAQWQCPSCRCRTSLKRGPQGPRETASYQVIHWHLLAEVSLGAGYGSSPKQFQNNRIHQGSKAIYTHSTQEAETLCSINHLCLLHPGSWNPLFHGL